MNIHPTIVPNVLDHFLRRPVEKVPVVGTLMGSVDNTKVDITTCFSVPLSEDDEDGKRSLVLDKDYLNRMLKFHKKVNPKEGLIGLYFSGVHIDKNVVTLFKYFQELSKDKKNKALLSSPFLMLIDPTMQDNRLGIKVSNAPF